MVNYELGLNILDIIFASIIIIMGGFSWYYVAGFFISFKRTKQAPHSDKFTKFAVLVPARNEGPFVVNIMKALQNQTYPKERFDVYFITEREDDPTNEKAVEHGFKYFVRDELTEKRKTKGFALQECIRYFKNNNLNYDAYMIFDADNVMDSDYLEKMNDVRQTGVEVAVGYRNFTNINRNWLTSGSAILFTYMNSFTSKVRTMLFKKALLTGTGYYINADIIDEAGGWIFTGMTEDTELTTYCVYHNVRMQYYPLINYYDEQSPSLRTNHNQHIRWVWGYVENRKRFKIGGKMHNATSKKLNSAAKFEYNLGIFPFVTACALDALCIIASLVLCILSLKGAPEYSGALFWHFCFEFGVLYLLMVFVAAVTIGTNYNRLKMKWWMIIICCGTYLFYFSDFMVAFLHGLFVPKTRRTWKPIKHTGKIQDKRAKKVSNNEKQ